MRILGAVLAGGTSTRFGSDKALALFADKPLIEHVINALLPQVETLVISGRDWPPYARVDDLPAPGLGPLSGLCGALAYARLHGFDAVLSAPCDTLGLPVDLVARLSPPPAVASGQRSVGLWPATLASTLLARLASGGNRSLHGWVTASETREVECGAMHNINHPDDLG